jgi:hypothetical protein
MHAMLLCLALWKFESWNSHLVAYVMDLCELVQVRHVVGLSVNM